MSSKYSVWTSWKLKTGDVAVSGSLAGPELMMGWKGLAQTPHGLIEVVIIGVGISNRTSELDRRGLLFKMIKGEAEHLPGAMIEFSGE